MSAGGRLFAAFVALALVAGVAAAEDRVTVRGVYYREASTRVVQPVVQVKKDLPEGYDVTAHFLMDAITSASVVASPNPKDNLFTEVRNETGFTVGRTFDRTRIGLFYRYSHEPDYRSNTGGLILQQGVWDNTGSLLVNVAAAHDVLGAFLNKHLNLFFIGGAYTQALSPTMTAQVVYDLNYQEGFIGNPYYVEPNLGHENPPRERLRHALALRVAKYFPAAHLGFQLHGRLYFDQYPPWKNGLDPWHMIAETGEARLYVMATRELEVRLSYRAHRQSRAAFYCATARDALSDCFLGLSTYRENGWFSADEKYGHLTTHYPELKLTWDMEPLAPLLRFLARGSIELSYGYYIQSTHYGNAHVLQTGYSLPF